MSVGLPYYLVLAKPVLPLVSTKIMFPVAGDCLEHLLKGYFRVSIHYGQAQRDVAYCHLYYVPLPFTLTYLSLKVKGFVTSLGL